MNNQWKGPYKHAFRPGGAECFLETPDGQRVMRVDQEQDGMFLLYDLRERPNKFLGEYTSLSAAQAAGERAVKPRRKRRRLS